MAVHSQTERMHTHTDRHTDTQTDRRTHTHTQRQKHKLETQPACKHAQKKQKHAVFPVALRQPAGGYRTLRRRQPARSCHRPLGINCSRPVEKSTGMRQGHPACCHLTLGSRAPCRSNSTPWQKTFKAGARKSSRATVTERRLPKLSMTGRASKHYSRSQEARNQVALIVCLCELLCVQCRRHAQPA